jgi:hypothetical protein
MLDRPSFGSSQLFRHRRAFRSFRAFCRRRDPGANPGCAIAATASDEAAAHELYQIVKRFKPDLHSIEKEPKLEAAAGSGETSGPARHRLGAKVWRTDENGQNAHVNCLGHKVSLAEAGEGEPTTRVERI